MQYNEAKTVKVGDTLLLTLPMPEGRGFLAHSSQPAPARSYAMSPSV